VFSFCDFYGRGEGRLKRALRGTGIGLHDILAPAHRDELERIARGFREIADVHGLEIFTCSEDLDLARDGIGHGACIDPDLIRKLFGSSPSG
jgi:hypothetical protein